MEAGVSVEGPRHTIRPPAVTPGSIGAAPKLTITATKTSAYTATANQVVPVDATAGPVPITLPSAVAAGSSALVVVKRISAGANAVTVATTSGQTIDGITSYVLMGPLASITVMSDGANWRAVAKINDFAVHVRDYGAKGDGVTDDTTAIRNAAATGASRLIFQPGANYLVSSVADGTPLLSWTGRNGVTIDAAESTLTNSTSYVADTITAMFAFDACKNVRVMLAEYVGYTLPAPETDLGYRGATLVRLINGCDVARIDARITNARYGVQSGDYADPTKGYNRNIEVNLRTSFCGYPLALYLAEGVRYYIDADNSHRAVYLAGCQNVKGVARWKDMYIAPYPTLITDAKTGTGTSRGSSNIKVASIDKGSTVFINTTTCVGLALSRVDPGIVHENIDVYVETRSTDTISSRVGGFALVSSGAAALTTPPAPFGWEPSITVRNIKVRGLIDHSAQTTQGNTTGDFFVRTWDTSFAHAATVENINVEDLIIKQSPGNTRQLFFECPGLINAGATFKNFSAPDATMVFITNGSVPTTFRNSKLKQLYVQQASNRIALADSSIDLLYEETANNAVVSNANSQISGAAPLMRVKQFPLNLTSGATATWTAAIPANVLVLGVTAYITTAITGPTSLQVGVAGDPARYISTSTLAQGTQLGIGSRAATEQAPWYSPASTTSIVATAVGGNFTAGQIRLMLTFIELTPPTS